jgi:hypothetical protein
MENISAKILFTDTTGFALDLCGFCLYTHRKTAMAYKRNFEAKA